MLRELAGWLPEGVRSRLRRLRHDPKHYAALTTAVRKHYPHLKFGGDEYGPWVASQAEGVKFYGFSSEPKSLAMFDLLASELPPSLAREQFRLMRDYVTRWVFPHMRPDIGPHDFPVEQRAGFHGQHRDDIASLADPAVRAMLTRAFTPGPADVVIDCGAFVGIGAIHMGRSAPKGRVLAVEASGTCHTLLAHNVAVNAAANVIGLHRAVWNGVGTMQLETTVAQGNSLLKEVVDGTRTETVSTVSIDSLVRDNGLDRLDMVSLTLNGAEVEALEGASDALTRLRPRIRAAGWYNRAGRPVWEALKPALESSGYEVHVGPHGNVLAVAREHADRLRSGA